MQSLHSEHRTGWPGTRPTQRSSWRPSPGRGARCARARAPWSLCGSTQTRKSDERSRRARDASCRANREGWLKNGQKAFAPSIMACGSAWQVPILQLLHLPESQDWVYVCEQRQSASAAQERSQPGAHGKLGAPWAARGFLPALPSHIPVIRIPCCATQLRQEWRPSALQQAMTPTQHAARPFSLVRLLQGIAELPSKLKQ